MEKRKTQLLLSVLSCLLAGLLLTGCKAEKEFQPYTVSGFYFDTFITFTIYDDPAGQEHAEQIGHDLKTACAHYERIFSTTIPESDVSRINAAHGSPVEVEPETLELLKLAQQYAELTNGAFDPTMKSVSDLWGIHSDTPRVPEADAIEEALQHVDYHAISLDDNRVYLTDPEAQLDLGGIAKGYIADQLTAYMKSQGIRSAVISLGGNIVCFGTKQDGSSFTIGLQKPFGTIGEVLATVQTTDQTIVTSGNYERYFEENGVIYHHIMDPVTGAPVQNDLDAVTILSASSAEADALSTACYVLGEEKSKELLRSLPNAEAIFIDRDLKIRTTDSFPQEKLKTE